jgi:hypothetical protein
MNGPAYARAVWRVPAPQLAAKPASRLGPFVRAYAGRPQNALPAAVIPAALAD